MTVLHAVRCSRGIQYEIVMIDGRLADRHLCRWCSRDAGQTVYHYYDRATDEPIPA